MEAGRKIGAGLLVSAGGTLLSRLLGLLREVIFASYFGTGAALGSFLVAFTIPNLLRQMLGEGVLSQCFVPLFNERLAVDGKAGAYRMLANVLAVVATVLAATVVLGVGGLLLLRWLWPATGQVLELRLLPLTLPYAFFVCLVGLLAGVLHSLGHFAVPALAPIILNVVFIVLTVLVAGQMENPERQMRILAWGVLLAGVLQLAALLPVLHHYGWRWRLDWRWRTPAVRELVGLMLPGLAAAALYQVNVLTDRLFARFLGGEVVTYLNYADRLINLPMGVFAVALSTACLPVMSRAVATGDRDGMADALGFGLRQTSFLTLPCALALFILGGPTVRLVYARGAFDAASVAATWPVLLALAPAIPAYAFGRILRSACFSHKDMRTPLRLSAVAVIANLLLDLVLMWPLGAVGLALATTFSACLHALLLAVVIRRVVPGAPAALREAAAGLLRLLPALLLSAAAMWLLRDRVAGDGFAAKALALLLPGLTGAAVYLLAAWLARAAEPRELIAALRRRRP